MVGSGDRSEQIRTYNFPQSRVTDHRVNLTLHQLDRVLDGDLDPIVDALVDARRRPRRWRPRREARRAGRRARPRSAQALRGGDRAAARGGRARAARPTREVLLAHVLGDRAAPALIAAARDRAATGGRERGSDALLGRRARREPVAYIVGEREFWSLPFAVDRARADPAAGDRAAGGDGAAAWRPARARVLDVGTGSGAIAAALARELPRRARSGRATLARRARRRARERGRHAPRRRGSSRGDLLAPFAAATFDLVVSNPPYCAEGELAGLAPEVRDFEPRLALAAGADGLDVLRALVADGGARARGRRLAAGRDGRGAGGGGARSLRGGRSLPDIVVERRPRRHRARGGGAAEEGGDVDSIVIRGGVALEGEVEVSGAKNAALPLLFATLLTPERCTLRHVPALADIRTTLAVLRHLGADVAQSADGARGDGRGARRSAAPRRRTTWCKTMRASFLVLGPLLARFGHARVSTPGGCAIGARPVDLHLRASRRWAPGSPSAKATSRPRRSGCAARASCSTSRPSARPSSS